MIQREGISVCFSHPPEIFVPGMSQPGEGFPSKWIDPAPSLYTGDLKITLRLAASPKLEEEMSPGGFDISG